MRYRPDGKHHWYIVTKDTNKIIWPIVDILARDSGFSRETIAHGFKTGDGRTMFPMNPDAPYLPFRGDGDAERVIRFHVDRYPAALKHGTLSLARVPYGRKLDMPELLKREIESFYVFTPYGLPEVYATLMASNGWPQVPVPGGYASCRPSMNSVQLAEMYANRKSQMSLKDLLGPAFAAANSQKIPVEVRLTVCQKLLERLDPQDVTFIGEKKMLEVKRFAGRSRVWWEGPAVSDLVIDGGSEEPDGAMQLLGDDDAEVGG